jgi:Lrp/AsnC family transcriptional regulator, leucine-responsive regulatory protein
MPETLDDVDRKLLALLQRDGRTTNAELARRVGLSPPSVLQRVRKLERAGYVRGFTALLDPERIGFHLLVVAMISLSLHQEQAIDKFIDDVGKIPEVLEVLHVSGEYDFMLKVVARDMGDYERFIKERLSAIPGVGKIHSCFVMGRPKLSTELPI